MTALALSFLTFASTTLGGLLALKFRDRLHHLLGFTAGVMLGVVAFDCSLRFSSSPSRKVKVA